ncbi:MAG: TolC family protein [Bacteroidetes bacterium]|nr:TolC family protein [Bacteroidota bacterium]
MKTWGKYLAILFPAGLSGQTQMNLNDVVNTVLQKNLQIRIAMVEKESARQANTSGNAGALPSVGINITDNASYNRIYQKLANGTEISRAGAAANSLGANVTAGYTLFNGYRIQAAKQRLEYLETLGEANAQIQIQQNIALAMRQYYNVIQQQQNLRTQVQLYALNTEKYKMVQARREAGLSGEPDLLQAEIDLNQAQLNRQQQEQALHNAYTGLLLTMGMPPETQLLIADTMIPAPMLQHDSLWAALQQNPQRLAAAKQTAIAKTQQRELEGLRYPSLRLNGGYALSNNNSAAGFSLISQSSGPFMGINAQIPLFTSSTGSQIAVSKNQTAIQALKEEQFQQVLENTFYRQWQEYTLALDQLKLQQSTTALARRMLQVSVETYRLGHSTLLELKSAESSFAMSLHQQSQLSAAVKMAEISLLELSGQLGR